MASLESLKEALRQQATKQPLSNTQYSTGFDVLVRGSQSYEKFTIPQLTRAISSTLGSRSQISVLEIGPGPKSVFADLPSRLRKKIKNYTAFEPNELFASDLEAGLSVSKEKPSLPSLESSPTIHRASFALDTNNNPSHRYDAILFCHSLYGMHPHHDFIQQALSLLNQELEDSLVVAFHRHGTLDVAGLVCQSVTTFPTGIVRVADKDEELDHFASLITGFTMQDPDTDQAVRAGRRKACRALGCRDEAHPNELLFNAPEIMMTFTRHATALPELTAMVPLAKTDITIKNREARLHRPAAIVQPTEIQHIQHCVRWALKHEVGLTALAGGHSGHCLWPGVVAIDMGSFNKIHIFSAEENEQVEGPHSDHFVLVETGGKTGDIIRTTMEAGLTVPLGSRPSVGAGLWLQGGIGHLSRPYGLASDAIVGAVLVGVQSGQIISVGKVPSAHRPAGAVRLDNKDEADLLWAIKGAGTNFGICVSVIFKASKARRYMVQNWVHSGRNDRALERQLEKQLALSLPRATSLDMYLYWDAGQLRLGTVMFRSAMKSRGFPSAGQLAKSALGNPSSSKIVDGNGLFETDMYMSEMHGGHIGGKTSAFKRCLFLKHAYSKNLSRILLTAIKERPSPLCYIHLLHGGGVIKDVAPDATAFGCRDWDYACVITGVWPRDQDGCQVAHAAVQWVYRVATDLLPLAEGVYGADIGADPRDENLAIKAFGKNLPRLIGLKLKFDPRNVLAYAFPLKAPMKPKIIIMVTGDSCVGKDHCAYLWRLELERNFTGSRIDVVSISDETKKAYATARGVNFNLLLNNREYKELHRDSLTEFFQKQLTQNPRLREEHFLNVRCNAQDSDVLFITGMRDEAPVANLSHLAANSRVFDVRVEASEKTRYRRRGSQSNVNINDYKDGSCHTSLTYRPDFIFHNNTDGDGVVKEFAQQSLFPLLDEDLKRLRNMLRQVPDFPLPGVAFLHVLDISQQPGGLNLCTSLLQNRYTDGWDNVGAVVCCEAGGFIFASSLAFKVDKPLALIREAGKLPPPTVSVAKASSHISSSHNFQVKSIEIGLDVVPKGLPVVVVDDVLATGETLCAVLELLVKAGINAEHVTVMTIVEFPYHRGRFLLHERGFGRVKVQSLLVYGGA